MNDRRPGALEEGPAGPQDYRRREGELDQGRDAGRDDPVQPERGDMAAHLQDKDRQRQDEAGPESAAHVLQLGVRRRLRRRGDRLKTHAADGAGAGLRLANLGMHGAGEDRARGGWGWPRVHDQTPSGKRTVLELTCPAPEGSADPHARSLASSSPSLRPSSSARAASRQRRMSFASPPARQAALIRA